MRNPNKDFTKLWPVIHAAYSAGRPAKDLARQHSISESIIHRRAKADGWLRPATVERSKSVPKSVSRVSQGSALSQAARNADKQANSLVRRAISAASREGTRIGHNAAAFVQRTLDDVNEWLDILTTMRKTTPLAAVDYIPQWAAVVKAGREAYRLDDVEPTQPLLRLDTVSQALDLVESSDGHWEQPVDQQASVVSAPECPVSTNHTPNQPPNT